MGYFIEQTSAKFKMAAKDKLEASRALKDLFRNCQLSWINPTDVFLAHDFESIMKACRYEVICNAMGDIEYMLFTGEKRGADEQIFKAIAPYVEEGSYIAFRGEDGALWRWLFTNGTVVREEGEIVYSKSDYKRQSIEELINDPDVYEAFLEKFLSNYDIYDSTKHIGISVFVKKDTKVPETMYCHFSDTGLS